MAPQDCLVEPLYTDVVLQLEADGKCQLPQGVSLQDRYDAAWDFRMKKLATPLKRNLVPASAFLTSTSVRFYSLRQRGLRLIRSSAIGIEVIAPVGQTHALHCA